MVFIGPSSNGLLKCPPPASDYRLTSWTHPFLYARHPLMSITAYLPNCFPLSLSYGRPWPKREKGMI